MTNFQDIIYRDDLIVTGSKWQILETLIYKVAAICREDSKVRKLYIGIASGSDAISAMKRRYDAFKIGEGINEMIALYESSSQQSCRDLESYLTEYFINNHPNIINRTGGGGGRTTEQPYKYVYLAVRRVG